MDNDFVFTVADISNVLDIPKSTIYGWINPSNGAKPVLKWAKQKKRYIGRRISVVDGESVRELVGDEYYQDLIQHIYGE